MSENTEGTLQVNLPEAVLPTVFTIGKGCYVRVEAETLRKDADASLEFPPRDGIMDDSSALLGLFFFPYIEFHGCTEPIFYYSQVFPPLSTQQMHLGNRHNSQETSGQARPPSKLPLAGEVETFCGQEGHFSAVQTPRACLGHETKQVRSSIPAVLGGLPLSAEVQEGRGGGQVLMPRQDGLSPSLTPCKYQNTPGGLSWWHSG